MTHQTQSGRDASFPETWDLAGKTAVISGGTTGIGRATALLLARKGVRVVIYGRHQAELDEALGELERIGGEYHGLIADNAVEADIVRAFREAGERFGDIDILINNASLPARSILAEHSYDEALYILRVSILGYLTCIREAVKMMRRKGGGRIINMGSMSAVVREPGADLYVAGKGSVEAFSESLRKHLAGENISISLIEPGLVGTNLHGEPPDRERQMEDEEAGRMMKAEDMALLIYHTLLLPDRCHVLEIRVAPLKQAI